MSIQEVNSRAEFPKLMEKTLHKAFHFEYNLGGSQYDKYWDVKDSTKMQEEVVETIVPVKVPQVNEGGMYSRAEMQQGRSKTFLHSTYKLEIIITEELQEDNLYPASLRAQKALAVAAKRTVEQECALTYIKGLTSETVPSGKLVFAEDHISKSPEAGSPATWSNLLVGYEFGTVGVKKMKTLMRKQRDEKAQLAVGMRMDQILVGNDLYEDALELFGSEKNYDSANLGTNQAKQGLAKPVLVSHFDDDDSGYAETAYFGRDSRLAMNIFFWRVRPQYKVLYEEATGNIIHRVRFRYSMGFVNPRGQVAAVPELLVA